ncbi:hypothetical protein AOLI_G00142790 [Acnodon oligacanthus]
MSHCWYSPCLPHCSGHTSVTADKTSRASGFRNLFIPDIPPCSHVSVRAAEISSLSSGALETFPDTNRATDLSWCSPLEKFSGAAAG